MSNLDPFADPDAAARKLVEIANVVESVQDDRIYIEMINAPFLYQLKGTPAEYKAGLDLAIAKAGFTCMSPGPTCGSPRQARRCSPDGAPPQRSDDLMFKN